MASLLASTWFLIEAFLIPDGLLKWFYLSFYIHPLLLILCQIILWVKILISWMKVILTIPLRIIPPTAIFPFGSAEPMAPNTVLAEEVVDELETEIYVDAHGDMRLEDQLDLDVLISSENESLLSFRVSDLWKENMIEGESGVAVTGMLVEMEGNMNEDPASVCSSRLTLLPMETADGKRIGWDPFYQKYTETMVWFDILCCDRTCGISMVLQTRLKERAKKRLIRSLESDLELVYVAQTCLSWEVLCYQQKKVEDLANLSPQQASILFDHVVVQELQKFQVVIERFLEDERCFDGSRYRSYVQARGSSKYLLQVPEIPGLEVEGKAGAHLNEVSKAIDKCIGAFHSFVKADRDNKSRWKLSSLSWSCPPVEDPRDLQLLAELHYDLRKKAMRLKDLHGKRKFWRKKTSATSPFGELQRKEVLFTEIDLEMISKVLHMSIISSSHLLWCQAKLDNICFSNGELHRAEIFPLFPS